MEIRAVCMEIVPDLLWTKGHVDVVEFLEAARRFAEEESEFMEDRLTPPLYAHYAWLRFNPDPSGEFCYHVVDGTPGKQGTFPATVGYDCDSRWGATYKKWDRMPGVDLG